ncbi:MAG: hypothetical protein ACE14W_04365 [Candidatus Velamenicoccus archaeovorus]
MWIVPVALVALGVVLFLVLRGGGATGGILGGGGADETVPKLRFRTSKVIAVPVTDTKADQLEHAARPVAAAVTRTMDALYTEAFLDPANWREGTYDDVWPLFEEGAGSSAQQQEQTLTLGTSAGDAFATVGKPKGKVAVKVLMNDQDRPLTAVAIVTFEALGTGTDGTLTTIVSKGQYFLRPASDGWLVYSFSVSRHDVETVPAPGPSASASAESS